MGIGKIVYTKIKEWGIKANVYDENGTYIGDDKIILSPLQRSADENISSAGRRAYLHNRTIIKPGYMIHDTVDKEDYFMEAYRSVGVKKENVTWSLFLVRVNARMTVFRKSMSSFDEDTGDATFIWEQIMGNIPVYIFKKDWTMEEMTRYGKNQKGYETVICQVRDIRKEDRIVIVDKTYLVQDINKNIHDNMLRIQAGLDIK